MAVDPRKSRFKHYLRDLADLMGLRDWTVSVHRDPPDDEHQASCHAVYGRKMAQIQLSENFLESVPDRQRQTLVHELMHAHFGPLNHLMRSELTDPGYRAFMLSLEYAIDGIAEEWAKRLPLPPEAEREGKENGVAQEPA